MTETDNNQPNTTIFAKGIDPVLRTAFKVKCAKLSTPMSRQIEQLIRLWVHPPKQPQGDAS